MELPIPANHRYGAGLRWLGEVRQMSAISTELPTRDVKVSVSVGVKAEPSANLGQRALYEYASGAAALLRLIAQKR